MDYKQVRILAWGWQNQWGTHTILHHRRLVPVTHHCLLVYDHKSLKYLLKFSIKEYSKV